MMKLFYWLKRSLKAGKSYCQVTIFHRYDLLSYRDDTVIVTRM